MGQLRVKESPMSISQIRQLQVQKKNMLESDKKKDNYLNESIITTT